METRTKKLKILIAEDNIYEQEILRKFVLSFDFVEAVDSVSDGYQAIWKLSLNNYDLIIIDFVMQNLDGLEVLDFLNSHKIKNSPKKLMISAVRNSDVMNKAFNLGVDNYIKKSFNINSLKKTIYEMFFVNDSKNYYNFKDIVAKFGVPVNLLGFKYICESLKIMIEENLNINQIYRRVSLNNLTSSTCVETNIRNAINLAHSAHNDFYAQFFDLNKKPKNSVFLHTILNIMHWYFDWFWI